MSYTQLKIWQKAHDLVVEIHKMTVSSLHEVERYETGSQIRRSIKSVKSNITEGYGRRNHKQDFLKFLYIALASNDETSDHLKTLYSTGSLKNKDQYEHLLKESEQLGKMINSFIKSVKKQHNTFPPHSKNNGLVS